jgi:hypothetical protein
MMVARKVLECPTKYTHLVYIHFASANVAIHNNYSKLTNSTSKENYYDF